jgi:hypothetical protein
VNLHGKGGDQIGNLPFDKKKFRQLLYACLILIERSRDFNL